MRVLMTGATGLIGKEVGKKLIEAGHDLVVLTRDPDRARKELPFPAQAFQWDSSSTQGSDQDSDLAAALSKVEGVIHLAGESIAAGRWTEKQKKKIRDSRVNGTRELVSALLDAQAPLKVFVLGSAVGFYGATGENAVDESGPRGTGFLADVTQDWEAQVEPLASKTRVAIVRTSMVLSRHGGALEKLLPLFERGVAGRLGDGRQWMSWIHLEDISSLFVFALENKDARGVLNGAAPEPVRNQSFTEGLAAALGRPAILPVPTAALKLALGEMSDMILDSQRVVPTQTEKAGFKFQYPRFEDAIGEIATPLKGGQHEIFSEQWLPLKPEELFPFYCDEKNLEKLTPDFMGFKVLNKSTPEIREGTLINYRLSLHGIPFKWQTQIKDWKPNERFVDTQLSGPYQKWHHVHDFIPFGGGTLVRDRVTYKLPLGFLGDTVAGWKVGNQVGQIFDYRREVIDKKFGNPNQKQKQTQKQKQGKA